LAVNEKKAATVYDVARAGPFMAFAGLRKSVF
jgi:hypothetical protein